MKTKLYGTLEAAEILGVKPNTLEGWRTRGVGPRFRKIGSLVKYSENDLEDYIEAQTRRSTGEVS